MDLQSFGLIPHNCSTVKIGDRFGRLIVLAIGRPPSNYRYAAICQCDCGSPAKKIRIDGLTSGMVIGCGCIQKERSLKHGLSKHPLWQVHRHILIRCTDPNSPSYVNYGGRGITICERWLNVANFVNDLKDLYKPGLEIDRIDNDGNYEPGNIRFVTHSENRDNRRTGHRLTFSGRTQSLKKWATETGLNRATLWERVAKLGWSVEKALTTPPLSTKERMAVARAVKYGK